MDDLVGKTLGNFEVHEMIGKGGMAAVYRGYQPSMKRSVAIKVMFPQYSSDESFVIRFKNEAQRMADLEHAHILPVIDFGEDHGTLFIVMRYLDTGSLKDRITSNGMDIKQAHRLFVQIASALDYAHSKGVIHRDLKPANILIDDQGNAFLTDFGIAKALEGGEQLTGTSDFIGTPSYMSPEQGMPAPVDNRSDIYSLGVLLCQMLTGKLPFTGTNPMAVMMAHINEQPPRPSSLKPGLNEVFDRVILRALAKRPEDRYKTAREMIEALDDAVALATGSARATIRAVGADARATMAAAAAAAATMPMSAGARAAAFPVEPVTITPTPLTTFVNARGAVLMIWLRALALSFATFLILSRLTPGNPVETGLLSLIPGILLYGLLRAPTLGGLSAFALIWIPLLVKTPGLGILWAVLTIVAGARLHHQEMLLTLFTMGVGGVPFVSLLIPLTAPWWLRARRTVMPIALGAGLATLFAFMLGWPTAGGLLPVSRTRLPFQEFVAVDRPLGYLALFDPRVWPSPREVLGSLNATLRILGGSGDTFIGAVGPLLLLMTAWALAGVVSVSNRRVQSGWLRVSGIGMAALLLLLVHVIVSPLARTGNGLPFTLLYVVNAALFTFVLTQWPLQVDPNAGNLPGTVQRLLRQALGALFIALGITAAIRALPAAPESNFNFLVLLVIGGVVWMLVNPLGGSVLSFVALLLVTTPFVITLAPFGVTLSESNPTATLTVFGLLVIYLAVNLIFDRRRPRRWNPIGAGALMGAPALAALGLLPIAPLSMGLLETQVPAAIFAIAMHVALWMQGDFPGGGGIIVQLVAAIVAVLLPQRLMDTPLLKTMHNKGRRMVFTLLTVLLVFPAYYGIGGVTLAGSLGFLPLYAVNLLAGAFLVLAMGDAAMYWESAPDPDADREEEDDPDTTS